MASGTINGGAYSGGYDYFMTWSSTSKGSESNSSDVTLNWIMKKKVSGTYYNAYNTTGSTNITLNVNGSTQTTNAPFDMRYDANGTERVLASYTVNVPHNSDGSKSITVSGSHATGLSGSGWGTVSIDDTTITLDTIPRYASITSFSVSKRDETSVLFNWAADAGCDWAWYSVDGGSNWYNLSNSNVVSGLSANTSYAFKLKIRRADSGLTTESGIVWQTTYDYPYITSSNDFNIGDNISLNIYNPLERWYTLYFLGNDNSVICTSNRSTNGGASVQNTSQEIESQYASIPNSNVGNYRVRLVVSSIGRDTTVNGARYFAKESECKPDVSAIFKDNKSSSIAQTGNENIIVKGVSNMLVTVSATPKHSATISSYSVLCDDGQRATNQVSTIIRPMSPIVRITVTDSRGFSNSVVYNLETLNQWLNYTILAYTSDIDVKRSEQLSDQVILNLQGNFFNDVIGQVAGYRNIRVGDDLSGKTIYCDFPDNTFVPIMHTGDYDIITATKKITQSYDSNTGEVFVKADSENLYYYDEYEIEHKVASYTLPNDFGVVTAIDSELDTYECIKILSDDTLVDNHNSLSMYFQYKQSGTNNWSDAITITPTISGNRFYVSNQSLGSIFNHNNEYVFRIITYDKLMQIGDYIEEVVTKATPIIRVGDEFVQVNGDLLINAGKVFASYTLYDNSSGEIGDITLNDFVSNYEYLEIIFKDNVEAIGSVKMIPSYSTKCNLTVVAIDDSNIQYIKNRQLNVIGNQITNYQSLHEGSMGNDGSQSVYTLTTAIKILKVIGYK